MVVISTLDRGKGFIQGDVFPIRRTVGAIPAGTVLAEAWLTVKADEGDADAATGFQKVITSSNVAGTGQIEDVGTTDGFGTLRFDIVAANTSVGGGVITADKVYFYDIQVRLDNNDIYTIEKGTVQWHAEITRDS